MAHGISVLDDTFNYAIDGKSPVFVYWGKKSIYHAGSNPDSYIDLILDFFNFPESWNVLIFFVSETVDAKFSVKPIKKDGLWKLYVGRENTNIGTFTAYAFVDSFNAPLADYGMELYDSSGNVTFRTSRPILKIKEVGSYTGTYKPASTGNAYKFDYRYNPQSNRYFNEVHGSFMYKDSSDDTWRYDGIVEWNANSFFFKHSFASASPVIDADYYDTFTSLPDL